MPVSSDIYVDVKKILLAHEYTLDRVKKCAYPRGRGSYGLVCALGGSAEYRFFSGESVTVRAGDVFFISSNLAYSIVTEEVFLHYTVNFDIHEGNSTLGELIPYYLLRSGDGEQLDRLFKRLVGVWTQKNAGYEMKAISCLCEIFSYFCLGLNQENKTSYSRLHPAREYIEQNFREAVDLSFLAHLSCMSMTNFRREWKKVYGETPLQYRDSLRIQHADEYLESGYYTVWEVAQKCGFEDVSYFVRFYKKKTGMTPGAFRDRT